MRDQLRAQPRTPSGSFWHKSIYPDQVWLDGVYMASPFLAEYGATFGEPEVFDDVVRQFTLAYEHTRDERTGLLFHAVDESRTQRWADPVTGQSRTFWGRAVGWYLMALVDAVELLPDAAQRATLLAILLETSEAVARVQDETGIWWQVLDQGGRAGNYLEQSCSSMFVYAFLKSARLGHLPAAYRDRAIQAQRGIVQHIRHSHGLRSRYARLRARGMLTRDEIADRLKVSADTVKIWGRHGLLRRHRCNDKHECLYEPPGPNAPMKMQGRRLSDRRGRDLLPDQINEVQYEA